MNTNKQQKLNNLYQESLRKHQDTLRYPGSSTVVFGEGDPDSHILFIGEAPGKQEDEQGRPFVGRSGALLNKILETVGTTRENVYITNIAKSRPPNNRKPTHQEIITCKKIVLEAQINILSPKIICTLGTSALEGLLERTVKITCERGELTKYKGIPVLPTYHPAYILRNPKELATLVEDIKRALLLSARAAPR